MFQEIILYDWRHICQHCYVANRSITSWLVHLAARLVATILNATLVRKYIAFINIPVIHSTVLLYQNKFQMLNTCSIKLTLSNQYINLCRGCQTFQAIIFSLEQQPQWPSLYHSGNNYEYHHSFSVFKYWICRGVLSITVCDKVYQWLVVGLWFSPGTLVF